MSATLSVPEKSAAASIPSELTSSQSKLVYLFLDVAGEGTIDELNESLGLQKIGLYPTLKQLEKRGFVTQNGDAYTLQNA